MSVIKITWLEDTSECEDCGSSWSSGAEVLLDDKPFLHLPASAHCYNGTNYEREDVYKLIIETLGYTIVQEDELPF
jgi:hypothetical protein